MSLSRVLTLSTAAVWGVMPDAIRNILPRPREMRTCAGGLHIALSTVGGPGTGRVARRLEEVLLTLQGVERAEVNGALGSIFVGGETDSIDLDKLLSIIDEFDIDEDGDEDDEDFDEEFDEDDGEEADKDQTQGSGLSSMVGHHTRAGIRLGASLIGTGLALAGRTIQAPSLSPAVPALLQLAESTPRIRHELEHRLGRPAVSALFATANIVTHTLALRPTGLLVQSVTAASRYVEARGMRQAWELHEQKLASAKGGYRHIRPARKRRPAPLAHSPVERFQRFVSPAALGASIVTHLVSNSRQQGLAMLITTTPKAARSGTEAFAAAVGRVLAKRGTIVLNSAALRHLDGIDTVVLDADMLNTGSWTIDRVVPLADDLNIDKLHARLYTLINFSDPSKRRENDSWVAEPLTDLDRLTPEDAQEWEARGLRPIGVTRQGDLIALVGLAPAIEPLTDAIVAAAGAGCTVMLAGGDEGLGRRLSIDEVLPGGRRLATAIRALQADGHGVAVVSKRSGSALVQADLGIGVLDQSGRMPWDGDVITEIDGVHLLLSCLVPARRTGEQCVWLSAAGAALGITLTTVGAPATAVNRANMVGDCTTLTAIGMGEWAARNIGRGNLPVPADRTPWHAMSPENVLSWLNSSLKGITAAEASKRRKYADPEDSRGPDSLLRTSVEELANPLTPVLGAGAGVSAVVGSISDSVLIAAVMLINALIGGGQRYAADQALHRLTESVAVRVRLRRPRKNEEATADNLVPGDVIELRAGDAVPADCRVLTAVGLEVDEASLTGESLLVTKSPAPVNASALADRSSMVYEGTTVAAGHGLAVVVAAGAATEASRTANLDVEQHPQTGVQLRLQALSRRILPLSIGAGVVLLVTELLRGRSISAALAPAVSLAVAAVPEGLPFVASVAELAAARRLSTRNTLVPNPSTIEALGRVNVLCFDKTGTLTEGHITLRYVSDGHTGGTVEDLSPELKQVVITGLRASPRYDKRPIPHPTDRAVIEGAEKLGLTPDEGLDADTWERVDELPFEPGRGYHAVLGQGGSGQLLSVKGAPEIVLTGCKNMLRDHKTIPLDASLRAELEEEMNRLAHQGYRVLAVAERPASDRSDLDESRVDGLTFLGFLGLADPVRPTAAESVGRLVRAGVRVVMITGDHPSTAEAIACELNVLDHGRTMTGPEVDALDDDDLIKVLPEVSVFARTTPAHKARIVSCLRRAGEVVAVTGDGANDAPAIRTAEVGIALGSRATQAARAAADVVVTDDRIETIVDAIIEGRAMWGSVRDALSILLGGNLGEIIFTVASSLIAGQNVLNARQLLLINLLTDMLPSMAVAVRPPASTSPEKLLAEGPEASLGASLTRDIYLRAAVTATAAGVGWTIGRMTGTQVRANTIGMVALVSAQLLQTLAMGSRDRFVVLAVLGSLVVLGTTVSLPVLCRFFGCRPLGPVGWSIALGSAGAATLVGMVIEPMTREMSPSVH
ncbi:cation-translocating P-type ATPase [Streptosporangium sp. 'caverna']|uniref:cation-translocating P-type ATPase n=1 Tax=Streptosporangium sp. 'caverna' TaxID=2202249 RepID=UPI000D7DE804|nr:cation-translocating P-type ATPase [Streptosporangium sp. 'caverna']AWS46210.1 magnesium-transporting ATPase [Streptosporangium sp. 'caverna']